MANPKPSQSRSERPLQPHEYANNQRHFGPGSCKCCAESWNQAASQSIVLRLLAYLAHAANRMGKTTLTKCALGSTLGVANKRELESQQLPRCAHTFHVCALERVYALYT